EEELGFERTGNFRHHSGSKEAYYQCYYTGKFELPHSYETLRIADGTSEGCSIDTDKFDVFFYPIEAVAGAETPVTTSLEEASDERFVVVVAHEDFHEMEEIQRLPTRFSEAAATLAGFLTAAELARREHGADSERYRIHALEVELYLKKASIVNSYHQELLRLYAQLHRKEITKREAAADKERLFLELAAACEAITPDPESFNKCPSANNNAGLAFDLTYTRFYPELYDLHTAAGRNLTTTIELLRQPARRKEISELEALRHFERLANDPSSNSQ
ncbi:MAG: hypothetical protein GY953_00275, partial [bacterium]|nr:hypothetical protein [bacterium]